MQIRQFPLSRTLDRTAAGDPGFQPAFERPDALVALAHQQAGDTRRAGLVGSTTVDDDLPFVDGHRQRDRGIIDIHSDCARNDAWIELARKRRARVEDQRS